MMYLMSQFWPWLLVAFIIGLFVGWMTCADEPTRWWTGWVPLGVAIFMLGIVIAVFRMMPGRTGLMLDSALLMFSSYIMGCCVGCLIKQWLTSKIVPAFAGGQGRTGQVASAHGQTDHAGAAAAGRSDTISSRTAIQETAASSGISAPHAGRAANAGATASAAGATSGASGGVGAGKAAAVAGATGASGSGGAAGAGNSVAGNAGSSALSSAGIPGAVSASGATGAASAAVVAATSKPLTSPVDVADASQVHAAADLPPEPPLDNVPANIPGKRPRGYVTALGGKVDDLKRIRGIGKQNEGRLHALGIWHFSQIAEWIREEIDWVSSYLAFPGRIDREDWVAQAKLLATGAETEFSKRVARGEVATSKDSGDAGKGNVADLPDGAPKPKS